MFLHHRVEYRRDVRMPELAGERGLVEELLAVNRPELGVAEYLGLDRLQRHFPAGKRVPCQVDGARGALPDELLDLVLPDVEAQVHVERLGPVRWSVAHHR